MHIEHTDEQLEINMMNVARDTLYNLVASVDIDACVLLPPSPPLSISIRNIL
jgi:hypothetical protein